MKTPLATITEKGKSVLRLARAVAPLLISQSQKASEAFAEHQLRLARADIAAEFIRKEVESLSKVKITLRNRYYEVGEEEHIRLRRDIDETDRELRRLNLFSDALQMLPNPEGDNINSEDRTGAEETNISLHWIDKFNEYARAHNEKWREQLLAAALALEAQNPGFVGTRALWTIGTIDDYVFHAYASLLDVSVRIGGDFMIPQHQAFSHRPVPNCALGQDFSIGRLIFILDETGLLGSVGFTCKPIPENSQFVARYGKKSTLVRTKKQLEIKGVIPTKLGETIANLYTPVPNDLGLEIYNNWLESLNEAIVEKKVLP